jgi:DNA-binding NarL/FixJ family response regulator
MITVLLVDDRPAVRRGLRMRLEMEPDVIVLGEASDGRAAVELAATLHPDVVVMDIEMPGMDGLTAANALRRLSPESAVIILTLYDSEDARRRAREAGAAAFIAKHEAGATLIPAIRGAAAQRPLPA